MTTLGAQGEAYSGIVGTGVVDCLVSTSETFLDKTEFTLHPNPAVSFVQLEFNWEMPAENVNIALRSADGKIVLEKEVTFFKGSNSIKIDLNDLQPGLFFPDLTGEKWKAGLNGFTIIK